MIEYAIPWRAPLDDLKNRQSAWLTTVARLKPGVTAAQAEASLGPLWHSLRAYELTLRKPVPERFRKNFVDNSTIKVLDDSKGFSPNRTNLEKPLIILFSMAGLLVAMCAINVATLLLLRASARAREMSMRYALGARRGRIVSQLMVEGGMLGLAGRRGGTGARPRGRAPAGSAHEQRRSGKRALFDFYRRAGSSVYSRHSPCWRACSSASPRCSISFVPTW